MAFGRHPRDIRDRFPRLPYLLLRKNEPSNFIPAMPIPLFTASEKPSNTETLGLHQRETVTSTPLTSGSPHEPTPERRRSSASEHHQTPAAASGSGTAGSASASGRGQTKEQREEAERLYEERMEDEYAKREGGA